MRQTRTTCLHIPRWLTARRLGARRARNRHRKKEWGAGRNYYPVTLAFSIAIRFGWEGVRFGISMYETCAGGPSCRRRKGGFKSRTRAANSVKMEMRFLNVVDFADVRGGDMGVGFDSQRPCAAH